MTRVVFELGDRFDADGQTERQLTLKEPLLFGAGAVPFPVTGTEAELVNMGSSADGVSAAGRYLFQRVMAHPAIKAQLAAQLINPPVDGCPIVVSLNGYGAEGFPFEAMFVPQADFPTLDDGARFLALDQRWPIARTVATAGIGPGSGVFEPPLRIVAVLSALGVPAAGEWEALSAAIRTPGSAPVSMLVLASEPEVVSAVNDAQLPGVSARPVPHDVGGLQEAIRQFQPHILHFFCHGTADGGGQLRIAIGNDIVTGSPTSSIVMEVGDLRACAPNVGDPAWLVLLNCCEVGNAGSPDLTSLALRLLQQGVFGAVIGMREPVLDTDAARFTEAFYGGVLADVEQRIAGTRTGPLRWPGLAVAGRIAVARAEAMSLSAAAAARKAWTLPVVFVAAGDFSLTVRQPLPAGPPSRGTGGPNGGPVAPVPGVPGPPTLQPTAPPPPVAVPAQPTPPPPQPVPGEPATGGIPLQPVPGEPATGGIPLQPVPGEPATGGIPIQPAPPAAQPVPAEPIPSPGPTPPKPVSVAPPTRAALLEIDLLRRMLAQLGPDDPSALRADVVSRLTELGAPVP